MNLRPLAFVLGAFGALALPVCNNSGVVGGGGGGAGGAGTCAPSCGAAVANGSVPCGGGSDDAYNALVACGCGTNGACNAACGANFCMATAADTTCSDCLQASCGTQLTDCAAD